MYLKMLENRNTLESEKTSENTTHGKDLYNNVLGFQPMIVENLVKQMNMFVMVCGAGGKSASRV